MSKTIGCPDPGTWRAYLDEQLPDATRNTYAAHLASCRACAAMMTELRSQAALVYDALDNVAVPLPQTRQAWQRTQARRQQLAQHTWKWRLQIMWQNFTGARRRPALAAAIVVLALVATMAVAPLRTAAARFLDIFRVQNLAVIQVDPTQMEHLADFQEQIFEQPQVDETDPTTVSTVEEATRLAGFPVLSSDLPLAAVENRSRFVVEGQHNVRTNVNVAAARNLLRAANLPPDALPSDVDKLPLSATVPPSVYMEYRSGGMRLSIVQGRSPQVDVPDNLDLAQLGEVGLQLLGMPADQAARMSRSIDWSTTLVVPVPTNVGSVREVTVRGTPGYVIQAAETARGGREAVVFWQANGVLYAVAGNVNAADLLAVAESLK